jgi:dTDP-glucose 4,6-dehydratase/UDP-glucose 4-epimerase
LRVFSAYGPGLKKQLFWDMYKKFKNNKIVELWGTGNESRDFIYISDLVRAVEFVVENADFKASIVNVANGVQVAVRDVSDTFVKVLQSNKSVMFNKEERKGDPIHWRADISDLKEWGYKPMVSLEEGVGRFVKWAEKELQ